jgi:hypothetical protein
MGSPPSSGFKQINSDAEGGFRFEWAVLASGTVFSDQESHQVRGKRDNRTLLNVHIPK